MQELDQEVRIKEEEEKVKNQTSIAIILANLVTLQEIVDSRLLNKGEVIIMETLVKRKGHKIYSSLMENNIKISKKLGFWILVPQII